MGEYGGTGGDRPFRGRGGEMPLVSGVDPDDLAACTVVSETCAMVIVAPLDGSPAKAAGLRAGDQVLAVDGSTEIMGS